MIWYSKYHTIEVISLKKTRLTVPISRCGSKYGTAYRVANTNTIFIIRNSLMV